MTDEEILGRLDWIWALPADAFRRHLATWLADPVPPAQDAQRSAHAERQEAQYAYGS